MLAVCQAAVVDFQLDPSRSSIAMSGSIVALGQTLPLLEQGPGSLNATYSGTLKADVLPTSVQFLGGNLFAPLETNSWKPALNGADGQALASYGAKATLAVSIFTANAVAASRGIVFEAQSAPLPLSGVSFPAAALVLKFQEGSNAVVDYRVTGATSLSGRKVLGGLLTNKVITLGSLANVAGVQTLTLPVNSTYAFSLDSALGPVIYNLTFTGQLVGTQGATELDPIVAFEPIASPGGPLVLKFPAAKFKLQHATSLTPPNWADFGTGSPTTVPTSAPGEYFRVVPR